VSAEGPETDEDKSSMDVGSKEPVRRRRVPADHAFDVWLERGLHAMYDDIANEPIPPELLAIIEQGRKKG